MAESLWHDWRFPHLQRGHQPGPLNGIGASVTKLSLVVVTPGEYLT